MIKKGELKTRPLVGHYTTFSETGLKRSGLMVNLGCEYGQGDFIGVLYLKKSI